MSGASGPIVTLHTPLSAFVSGCGLPSSSPFAVTAFAFGANRRSVTLRSALTSGDVNGGGPPCCAARRGENEEPAMRAASTAPVIVIASRIVARIVGLLEELRRHLVQVMAP